MHKLKPVSPDQPLRLEALERVHQHTLVTLAEAYTGLTAWRGENDSKLCGIKRPILMIASISGYTVIIVIMKDMQMCLYRITYLYNLSTFLLLGARLPRL